MRLPEPALLSVPGKSRIVRGLSEPAKPWQVARRSLAARGVAGEVGVRRTVPVVGVLLVVLIFLAPVCAAPAETGADGVVHAVLFSSPTCPHCRKVREHCLPALFERFGDRLQVAVLSTATQSGSDLYWSTLQRFGLLRRGVPLLVIGDTTLMGSVDIPEKLPDLVARHLARGGVAWPDIPGLSAVLAADSSATQRPAETSPTAAPPARRASSRPASAPSPVAVSESGSIPAARAPKTAPVGLITIGDRDAPLGPLDRFRTDPLGNGVAVLVLVAMVGALLRTAVVLARGGRPAGGGRWDGLHPVLALLGFAVAAYLANVEVRDVEAVCGPVGDCNTVQRSEYARLFGVVPIGVLGVLGFAAILLAWIVRRWGAPRASTRAATGLLLMTGAGTLFSVYLTFLEPFVIGATCLWCLSSSVLMTGLHLLALPGGQARSGAPERLRRRASGPCRPGSARSA